MTYPRIVFGTDGWRAQIAGDYTFSSVKRCAQGFASYIAENSGKSDSIVVGYDRRFASHKFSRIVSEVLAGNGFTVYLTDRPTPTPAISYSVVEHAARGAVNITASHNPALDNGLKVRDSKGGAIDPQGLNQIEALIPDSDSDIASMLFEDAIKAERIQIFDPAPAYLKQIARLIDVEPIRNAGLNIMVEPMWGNGSGWLPRILGGGTTHIREIHYRHNPIFPEMIRPEPIPPNIDVGLSASREHGADALIIYDGDADRLGLGDENGNFIDQLRTYALLAYYMLEVRNERGPLVKTLSTTSMINKLGKAYDVPVYETGVGFKFVAPKMLEVDALIGGEESGGYAFRGHVPERDGILASLYILDMMVALKLNPSQLVELVFEKIGSHYYDRIDSPLPAGQRQIYEDRIRQADPQLIGGLKVTGLNTLDGYKFSLEDGGWLLIRFSGTEPVVRVYCETTSADRVQPILKDGLNIVGIG